MATIPVPMDDVVAVAMQQSFADGQAVMREIRNRGLDASNLVASEGNTSRGFIGEQSRLQFLGERQLVAATAARTLQVGAADAVNGAILAARDVRDQPGVSPAGAFTQGTVAPAPK